eukprot:360045-Chlamydomonas_euryale.AAC.3
MHMHTCSLPVPPHRMRTSCPNGLLAAATGRVAAGMGARAFAGEIGGSSADAGLVLACMASDEWRELRETVGFKSMKGCKCAGLGREFIAERGCMCRGWGRGRSWIQVQVFGGFQSKTPTQEIGMRPAQLFFAADRRFRKEPGANQPTPHRNGCHKLSPKPKKRRASV